MLNFSLNIYSILTEIYIVFCGCFLLLISVIFNNNLNYGSNLITKNIQFLFIQILFFCLILSLNQCFVHSIIWNHLLINDSFSFYSKILILLLTIIWFFISLNNINLEKINNFEYWILILFSLLAGLLILKSFDILSVYLLIEFQSLIFYILASFKRNSEFSTEAGIKYFILGALSSSFLLFGFSLLYNVTGLTNFNDFYLFFIDLNYFDYHIFISVSFIMISLLFKLNVAPFHVWSPDVYEGSPSSVTAFFSTIPKLIIISLLLRFSTIVFYDLTQFWYYILVFCIIMSSLVGVFLAFKQTKWKRFIVFSSISHFSFLLLPLLIINNESLNNVFQYLFVYLIMNLSFFAIFLNTYYKKTPFLYQIRFLKSFESFVILNPLLSVSLTLILFSMAGIPPMSGFYIKFFIIFSSLNNKIINLILIILLFNAISVFYYIRLIKSIYFSFQLPKIFNVYIPINKSSSIVLILNLYLLLFVFYESELLYLFSNMLSYSFI